MHLSATLADEPVQTGATGTEKWPLRRSEKKPKTPVLGPPTMGLPPPLVGIIDQ